MKISKELGDRLGERSAYGSLGNAYHRLGEFKTATDYHERVLKISKELADREGEGTAYSNLSHDYHSIGEFKIAKHYGELSLKVWKELDDKRGEQVAYGNLGNAYCSLGEVKTAIDYHLLQLKISKTLGDRSVSGGVYCNLGSDYVALGEIKTGIEYYELCLKICKELGDRWGEGKTYGNLGTAYHKLGEHETALDYHKLSLEIFIEMGDCSGESIVLNDLGRVYRSLGEFKTAIDYYERFLKRSKELGDRSREGRAYVNLGNAHYILGECKTAIDYLELALEIFKELGDRPGESGAYSNLGNAYRNLGEFKRALDYHELHLKLSKELDDKLSEGIAYANLGNVYLHMKAVEKAVENFKFSLKIFKKLGVRSEEGKAYASLGNAYFQMKEFKTAMDYLKLGRKIFEELGEKLLEANACVIIGLCHEELNQIHDASKYSQSSVKSLDKIRSRLQQNDKLKISLRDKYHHVYENTWHLLLKENKVEEALYSAEKGRAQALNDLMELNYAFETTDARQGVKKEISLDELLSCVPSNTIFVAFEKKEIVIWVCQKGKDVKLRRKEISLGDNSTNSLQSVLQITAQEIGNGASVKCEDRSLSKKTGEKTPFERSPLGNKKSQPSNLHKSALETLYETIIDPVKDLLQGNELTFVPEGPLCLAPFPALKDPTGKFLCESLRIRVIPSLTSLKLIADCPADFHRNSGALLVGDPCVDQVGLPPLPAAKEEVNIIGKMLNTAPLTGTEATKEKVLQRLSSVALVHIAAHGRMETGEIALAPNPFETSCAPTEEDYILTMKDVLSVQLRARLVVLSCCHSAQGEVKAEGVVGIARAFLGAGARSVLVSLWAVDDKATLEFMKSFYQVLLEGKSASKAVNQAMKCLRESDEFNEVKFWAPFVLVGDDVTLDMLKK